jgi:hypothetical protein
VICSTAGEEAGFKEAEEGQSGSQAESGSCKGGRKGEGQQQK